MKINAYWKNRTNLQNIITVIGISLLLLVTYMLRSGLLRASNESYPEIHVFSSDVAPQEGVMAVYVQYGMNNVPEGWLIDKWLVNKGEQLNRDVKMPRNKYARVWFRPDGVTHWQLLPSQYWDKGGSCQDEFGVSPRSDHPSYSTNFERRIDQNDIPLFVGVDDCPFGSSSYNEHRLITDSNTLSSPTPSIVPSPTSVITPVPTLCVVLRKTSENISCD